MKHYAILLYALLSRLCKKPFFIFDATLKLLYLPGYNKLRLFNASANAYAVFFYAKKKVPAYKSFLQSQGFSNVSFKGIVPNINEIPFTDKENYVNQFSIKERCIYGNMPNHSVIIDESSGSSGMATNWARGRKEREINARMIQFGMRNLFGKEPLFIINAFAMGPWATGVNVTMSCSKISTLKSIGPDKIKIENTLLHFGKAHKYILMGYPPFFKMLIDEAAIDWHAYNVSLILGGESMSENMRAYLIKKGIKNVYSSYGASDIELNISAENDATISIRKLIEANNDLRKKILKHEGAMPMVFQYNPADFLIESSDKGELIITVCRSGYIAPKIRYNIHDKGHVLQMKSFYALLKELNIDEKNIVKPKTDLPLLFHYGRADMTVSFFGANISPTDVQETLYNLPELISQINSFALSANENINGEKELIISLEMQKSKTYDFSNLAKHESVFFERLANANQDFREAKKMLKNGNQTKLLVYNFNTGPFKNSEARIKAKYI